MISIIENISQSALMMFHCTGLFDDRFRSFLCLIWGTLSLGFFFPATVWLCSNLFDFVSSRPLNSVQANAMSTFIIILRRFQVNWDGSCFGMCHPCGKGGSFQAQEPAYRYAT